MTNRNPKIIYNSISGSQRCFFKSTWPLGLNRTFSFSNNGR